MTEHDKRVILIRHLSTQFNIDRRYIGRDFDPSILGVDVDKIERSIEQLKNYNLGKIKFYSSPRRRCLQTIDLVMDLLGNKENSQLEVVEEFDETDLGDFSGLTGSEIRQKYPELIDIWMNNPQWIQFPGGENYQNVQDRAFSGLAKIFSKEEGIGTIIICSHVDIIKMILLRVQGKEISYKNQIQIENGSVSLILFRRDEETGEYFPAVSNFD